MHAAVILLAAVCGQSHDLNALSNAVRFGNEEESRTYVIGSPIVIPIEIPELPENVTQKRSWRVTAPASFRRCAVTQRVDPETLPDGLRDRHLHEVVGEEIHLYGPVNPKSTPLYELVGTIYTIDWTNRDFDIDEIFMTFTIDPPAPPDDPVDPDDPIDPVDPDPEPQPSVPEDRFDNLGRAIAAEMRKLDMRLGSDYARVYGKAGNDLANGDMIASQAVEYIDREIKSLHSGTPPERDKWALLKARVVAPAWDKHIKGRSSTDGVADFFKVMAAGFKGGA